MTKISVPRGTCDILPESISQWQNIEQISRQTIETYGYTEIRTPIFEQTGLFQRSLGQSSEVVNKQLLELKSSKEDGFSLRPEGTASIVRSYIENRFDKKEGVSKLYYIGPMFRGERPQKGRLRQFHQIGAEVIGPDTFNPYVDAEVIALSFKLLESFGVKGFKLRINTLGSGQDKENLAKWLREELGAKISDLDEEDQQRFERNVFRVLDSKNRKTKAVVKQLKMDHHILSEESRTYYFKVKEILNNLNIDFEEDLTLVRGLDYYTHTVFELSHDGLGSQDALGAGGRYNNLVNELGGPDVYAIGFALGIERILLAAEKGNDQSQSALDAYVIALNETCFDAAFKLVQQLRESGVSCNINLKMASMKSQMRSANKSGARFAVILGEEELQKQVVVLKDMHSSEQNQVSIKNNKLDELIINMRDKRTER